MSASRGFPNWLVFVLAFVGMDALLIGVFFGYLNLPSQVATRLDRIERELELAIGDAPDYARMAHELRALEVLHARDARVHAVTARVAYERGYRYSVGARAVHDPEALTVVLAGVHRALQLDSTQAQARRLEAAVLLEQHQPEEARRAAEAAERLAPNLAANQLMFADLAMAREDWEASIHHAESAKLMSASASVHIAAEQRLCDVWLKLGRLDRAESCHVAILRYASRTAWSHHNYGLFLLHQNRFDDAIRQEQRALAVRDFMMARITLSAAWYGKGLGYLFEPGQAELSKTCFEKAIATDSTNANAWYGLAMYLETRAEQNGDRALLASAGTALQRAAELDPTNGVVRAEWMRHQRLRESQAQLDSARAARRED